MLGWACYGIGVGALATWIVMEVVDCTDTYHLSFMFKLQTCFFAFVSTMIGLVIIISDYDYPDEILSNVQAVTTPGTVEEGVSEGPAERSTTAESTAADSRKSTRRFGRKVDKQMPEQIPMQEQPQPSTGGMKTSQQKSGQNQGEDRSYCGFAVANLVVMGFIVPAVICIVPLAKNCY